LPQRRLWRAKESRRDECRESGQGPESEGLGGEGRDGCL
jgi:hypothetical protein